MKDVVVPALGESITEAIVAKLLVEVGSSVDADQALIELETDKVTVEVPSPVAGTLAEFSVSEGDTVEIGKIVAKITEGAVTKVNNNDGKASTEAKGEKTSTEPINEKDKAVNQTKPDVENINTTNHPTKNIKAGPKVRQEITESGLNANNIKATGPRDTITSSDVKAALTKSLDESRKLDENINIIKSPVDERGEERVRMSSLRKTIAKRLKEAQNTAAILTTFNEANLDSLIKIRNKYKDDFQNKFGVKLGFMSFFVKAVVSALKEVPAVNSVIEGSDIIYKKYYDIGIAVGSSTGLVVPVLKNASNLSFPEIEIKISEFGKKAREGKLKIEELLGGTFTISNGGVFGSMLSTPIINVPQSGILGLHNITKRPIVIDDKIVIANMMYLALSYDHRVVDGREAVGFLVKIKSLIEDPASLLFEY